MQSYVGIKDCFPGYRQPFDMKSDDNHPIPRVIINWSVMLWPFLERTDLFQLLQSQTIASIDAGKYAFPYFEVMVCPSDYSILNKTAPWSSYVVNTGRFDKIVLVPIPYIVAVADQPLPLCTQPPYYGENFATGIFLDRVLINGKQTTADIKDGSSRTLMISENLDAEYYNDGPGSDTNLVVLNTSGPKSGLVVQLVDAIERRSTAGAQLH